MPRTWTAPYPGAPAPKSGGPQGQYNTSSGSTTVQTGKPAPKGGARRKTGKAHFSSKRRRTHRRR